jgi:hypothetical protein
MESRTPAATESRTESRTPTETICNMMVSIDELLSDRTLLPIDRMRLEDMRRRWWQVAAERGLYLPLVSLLSGNLMSRQS